jgi:uncharacterized protein (TIGR03086 family)
VGAIERHGRALTGFTTVVEQVPDDAWQRPTPCTEWDARALVEHVIGFHEFLVLRPLGLRAHRPRSGPAARWHATETALRHAHADSAALEEPAETFDGARRRPADVLDALAADTLIHTWDLARAVGAPDRLDRALCERSYDDAVSSAATRAESGLYGPPVPVAGDADLQDRLLGLTGRDPAWRPAGR